MATQSEGGVLETGTKAGTQPDNGKAKRSRRASKFMAFRRMEEGEQVPAERVAYVVEVMGVSPKALRKAAKAAGHYLFACIHEECDAEKASGVVWK